MSKHFTPGIPKDFHSFETGKPFEECMVCGKNVLESGEQYMIEKAIRQYEGFTATDTIFEYAMCMPCAEILQNDISKESMTYIQQFFQTNVNMTERFERAEQALTSEDSTLLYKNCLISGEERNACEEYQLVAVCKGDKILPGMAPYMISGQVLEKLSDGLSKETQGFFNDFMDNFFGVPPELAKELRPKVVLL